MGLSLLGKEIARKFKVEKATVVKELKKREDLAPFHDGDNWRLPEDEKGYDL